MINKNKNLDSWYSRSKKADASSGSQFGTGGRLSGDGPVHEWTGVKTMLYRPFGSSANVSVGDTYRKRSTGVAFEAGAKGTYKVVSKNNGNVILEDADGKKHYVEIGIELPAKYLKV